MEDIVIEKDSGDLFQLEIIFSFEQGVNPSDFLSYRTFFFRAYICEDDIYEEVIGDVDSEKVMFTLRLSRHGDYKCVVQSKRDGEQGYQTHFIGTYRVIGVPVTGVSEI